MSDTRILEAAREGDSGAVAELLGEGADVHAVDEYGWTPLSHAAGGGDLDTVALLLEHGADVTRTGRDNRTPLMIARAAGHTDVVERLTAAEKEAGVWKDPRESRPYSRAYRLSKLAAFDGFDDLAEGAPAAAGGNGDAEDPIVYLHQDFTVTASMWHGEDVLVERVDDEWRRFCREELEFEIPADLL